MSEEIVHFMGQRGAKTLCELDFEVPLSRKLEKVTCARCLKKWAHLNSMREKAPFSSSPNAAKRVEPG